jgi:predicted amidohydrolase
MKLEVATCQFPVSADLRSNARYVMRQMRSVAARGAQVAHFCECSLSGYAGPDFASYRGFDWDLLDEYTQSVLDLAAELEIWVILGSTHRLSGRHKPHNSVYVINDRGKLIDRYDKMFCAGDRKEKTVDLAHYSPGNHFSVFQIGGIRCGVLICYDYRFPEVFREYKRRGVEVLFHSFHAGHISRRNMKSLERDVGLENQKFNRGSTLPSITMPATMQATAGNSHFWISCSNTSAPQSCWPSFFVRPDGVITGRLRRNRSGILHSTVDTNADLYDSTEVWRHNAMRGVFHSGTLIRDKRSSERKKL